MAWNCDISPVSTAWYPHQQKLRHKMVLFEQRVEKNKSKQYPLFVFPTVRPLFSDSQLEKWVSWRQDVCWCVSQTNGVLPSTDLSCSWIVLDVCCQRTAPVQELNKAPALLRWIRDTHGKIEKGPKWLWKFFHYPWEKICLIHFINMLRIQLWALLTHAMKLRTPTIGRLLHNVAHQLSANSHSQSCEKLDFR